MHRCLLIPELTLYIIHFLADDRPAWHDSRYIRNPRDVSRLARTCKTLAEPALDVLWKTQHSLSPLVMCLPQDIWELTKRGKAITFKRDPRPLDWVPVKKYAHRVRSISQPASFALPRLDDAALTTMITSSNFGALFPSLRALDYSVISVAAPMIHLLTKVLSTEQHLETIMTISVICPRASQREEVYDLFQAIRTKATHLETLRIESFASGSSNGSLAVKLVKGEFKFLRKLDLSWTIHVSAECLTCLARMVYLEELGLYVRREISLEYLARGCWPVDNGACPSERTFPALRSLKIMAYSLDQCTALLALVTSPFLDNLIFSYDVQAPGSLIETFFRQVQKTCQNRVTTPATVSITLKHNLGPYSSATSPFLIHPSETLSPLFALRHLRALRLLHLGTIAIDDAFLREAASAWGTHLQELEECGIPWVGADDAWDLPGFVSATLDGIGAFVRRCPRLEKLRVAFDGRCFPWACVDEHRSGARDEGGEGRSKCEEAGPSVLQVLNVRDSPIDNPECVAKFLKQVAPALRAICVEGSMDMWRKWREVEDRMNPLQIALTALIKIRTGLNVLSVAQRVMILSPTPPPPSEPDPPMAQTNPRIASLKAIFPDFDDALILSVLDTAGGDDDRAADVLLAMADPTFIPPAPATPPPTADAFHPYDERQSQEALDEEFARRLALEEQENAARARTNLDGGMGYIMYQPYQGRRRSSRSGRSQSQSLSQSPQAQGGRDTMTEVQEGFNRIAESGKKTFASIMSKVRAKMQDFEHGQGWSGSQSPPLDQPSPPYASPQPNSLQARTSLPSYPPASGLLRPVEPQSSSYYDPNAQGYDLYGDDEATLHTPSPLATAPPASVLSPAAPTPLTEVPEDAEDVLVVGRQSSVSEPAPEVRASPSPPPTTTPPRTSLSGVGAKGAGIGRGAQVDFTKLGLLPKRPISLVRPQSPPASGVEAGVGAPRIAVTTSESTTDSSMYREEPEFVENPFEDRR